MVRIGNCKVKKSTFVFNNEFKERPFSTQTGMIKFYSQVRESSRDLLKYLTGLTKKIINRS